LVNHEDLAAFTTNTKRTKFFVIFMFVAK